MLNHRLEKSRILDILCFLLGLALVGCQKAGPQPSPRATVSSSAFISASPSASPPESKTSPLESRYQELLAQGKPEQITSEFGSEELVRQAAALFPQHEQRGNLHLHSDREFASADGQRILELVEAKLLASPLYDPSLTHRVFLCHDAWREEFFLKGSGRLGGLNYWPVANHVFLPQAGVAANALISPRGRPIAAPRTLAYYMAHEITHSLVGIKLGKKAWEALPTWIFEGYPDWVGLGPDYSHSQALKSYQARPAIVAGTMAEDYMRYGVQVAWYLDVKGISAEQLLVNPPNPPYSP